MERFFLNPGRRIVGSYLRIFIVTSGSLTCRGMVPAGHNLTVMPWEAISPALASPPDADVVVFDLSAIPEGFWLDRICFALHRHGVLTIGLNPQGALSASSEFCHYQVHQDALLSLFDNVENRSQGAIEHIDLAALARASESRRRPRITLAFDATFVSTGDLIKLEHASLDVETVALPRTASLASWANAIAEARGEIVVFVAAAGNMATADFVETCVFEHWYPDVAFCCERRDTIERWGLDLRRISFRGRRARADVIEAISSSSSIEAASGKLRTVVSDSGDVVAMVAPDRHARGPNNASRDLLGRGLSKLRTKLQHFGKATPIRGPRRLRVLAYRWHVAHQYEIMRLPADFTLATGFEGSITEFWGYDQRPQPPNVRFLHRSRIDPKDYDVAIVHFDENVLCPELSNGVLPSTWGDPFSWLLSLDSIPKIAICHGTPAFKGQYALDPSRKTTFEIHETERSKLVRAVAEAKAFVVCNSFQAQREWGFENSRVIWHGFDPGEFRKGSASRGVLTSPDDLRRPHYRGRFEQQEVLSALAPGVDVCRRLRQVPLEIRTTNAFASRQFRFYVDQIGDFKFYLNTTLRSPMPRSRGEAMTTGVIPVSLANHDVEMFTENGRDGFFSSDTKELATFINEVARDERAIKAIGEAARSKAIDVFHIDRFLADWRAILKDAIG